MGARAIDSIRELHGGHVKIRDQDHVDQVLTNIIKGGSSKLQVIADFDMTLSAFTVDGEKCVSCHKALDDCPKLCNSYRKKAYALRDHYYQIEIDPNLTLEEKVPHMVTWWTQSHDLMLELNLNKEDICHIVRDSKLKLRKRCDELFTCLHQQDVPLLIFSAGIGNVIEEAIKHQAHMHDNMHIVSNFMNFSEEGKMVGFKGDLIHSFNKNESSVHDSDYFDNLEKHNNILLLGDSIGDLRMADGAKFDNILKIGFLNDKIEERMDDYLQAFDIVLVSDETMDVTQGIVNRIISK